VAKHLDFSGKRVVIAGDLVADQFLNGTIARVSREAPVFILRHDETDTRPGAAANTAANVASLGGEARLVGAVGDDANCRLLIDSLPVSVETSGILTIPRECTTTKVRVLAAQHYAARQQVIRIDYENSRMLSDESRSTLTENLVRGSDGADAIVLSDYGYGVVDDALFTLARQIAADMKIPLIVDSRTRLPEFAGATSATPNQEEVEQILGKAFTDADCEMLRERLGLDALLVTRGNKGMLLVESGKTAVYADAVGSSEPVDVTGAGDTVIAAYALGLAAGLSFVDAARIANHAGGIVVMKKGTATATADELFRSLAESESTQPPHAAPAN
jgi:D-glycero-beta-D-manno-heptose-7-phosphate kinase